MLFKPNIFTFKLVLVIFLSLYSVSHQARELQLESLTITNSDGKDFLYNVEVARTPSQKKRGLMFRDSMPEDEGMLFIYMPEKVAAMWMRNTILALDMLFIDKNGMIVTIADNTVPYSLNRISSGQPVRAVLELNAGQTKKNNLNVGDKVSHKLWSGN